jgi:hypothetical protein
MFGRKVAAPAKIIADEGYKFVNKDGHKTLQHETYIVEVHPDDETAFRTEVKAWVSWPDMPKVGDTVQVTYRPGTHKVEMSVEGDPRFDWKLLEAKRHTEAAETRERLLNEPVPPDAAPQ